MQEHLEERSVDEVLVYIEKTLSDDRLDEFGGAEAFLDAVENAERAGENREEVLEYVDQKREGESQ
jgi:hypothetical protein